MTSTTMPGYIQGDLANTWQAVYNQATDAGQDPSQPVLVTDKSLAPALEDLQALGGATVVTTDEGLQVTLKFADEPPVTETASVRAAAKESTFATRSTS